MRSFTTETQGLDTFLVYEISGVTQLDTVGLGMVVNNKIAGLCPVSRIQIVNKEYIRYNISSHIPLKQFFTGKVNKRRFLTVMNNILTTIENIEEYMLDPEMLMLGKSEIYVNVGTLQTSLLYNPIIEQKNTFDVVSFVKKMIISVEFDSNEQDNYIPLLISYLNHTKKLTITEIRNYIAQLLCGTNDMAQQSIQPMQNVIKADSPVNNPMISSAQQAVPSNMQVYTQNQAGYPVNGNAQAQPQKQREQEPVYTSASVEKNKITSNAVSKEEKNASGKKGFFSKLGLSKKKEKKEKPNKTKKASDTNNSLTDSGMDIPGVYQGNDKEASTLSKPRIQSQPTPVQQVMQPTPVQQVMQPTPVQQVMQPTPVQQVAQPKPVQPIMQSTPMEPTYNQVSAGNQRETAVLGAGIVGETTVLNAGYNTLKKVNNPYLIRKKTNEKVEINKSYFRIGKERNYVDYCIADNSAVSRSHADIIRKNDEYYIIDNNSLNHTFLDNKQIPSSQMQKLEDFMIIKLADEIFEFRL